MAHVVSCQGVVQRGGPDPCYNQGGLAKVGAHKSFLFTENSLVYEIKNTWLIWLLHYFSPSLSANKALWRASCSNPHPYFSNCMQNDVTSVHCCLTSFRKKTVYYSYSVLLLYSKYRTKKAFSIIWKIWDSVYICFRTAKVISNFNDGKLWLVLIKPNRTYKRSMIEE